MTNFLVTGATGTTGELTIKYLEKLSAGNKYNIVAAVRNLEGSKQRFSNKVELRRFDLEDPSTFSEALEGIDRIFFMRPPQISDVDKYIRPFTDKLKKSAVKKVVFLSVQGAEKNKFIPHHKIEKLLEESGVGYVFLRPSYFMQNLTENHLEEIRDGNQIYVPAGKGKTNYIDAEDIAEAAALCLVKDDIINSAYELTGYNYTYYEIADIISNATGKKVIYKNPSIPAFIFKRLKEGDKLPYALVMTTLYTIAKLGKAGNESDDLVNLLGRKPKTFEQFAEENQNLWIKKT